MFSVQSHDATLGSIIEMNKALVINISYHFPSRLPIKLLFLAIAGSETGI